MKKFVFAVAIMIGAACMVSCTSNSNSNSESSFVLPDSDSTFVSAIADTLRGDSLTEGFNPDSLVVDTVPVYL
jgi:hypothetical protein